MAGDPEGRTGYELGLARLTKLAAAGDEKAIEMLPYWREIR